MDKKNEFATAARRIIFSDQDPTHKESDDDAGAIDDSSDADEELVATQRNIMQLRIQRRNSEASMLQKVIPFHWAPMLCPLTESDSETCVTLESAAFPDPNHRATREMVSQPLSFPFRLFTITSSILIRPRLNIEFKGQAVFAMAFSTLTGQPMPRTGQLPPCVTVEKLNRVEKITQGTSCLLTSSPR